MTSERVSQFSNGDLTFDVIDSGPIDGTPVVLLHGFPQRASCWAAVSEHLHERGLRTYAPDQRGYSPGARPRTRWGYRGTQLRNDIFTLLSAIGSPVHLVGHDFGAAMAWSVAGHSPERITSLTAVSVPHPGAFVRSMFTSSQALKSFYIGAFQLPVLPELTLKHGPAASWLRNSGMTREMVETFKTDIVEYGALSGGIGWYRALPFAPPSEFSGKITVPTTFVWSDGDVALGRKGAELTERYMAGPYEFEVYEGASHWIPDELPERLGQSIAKRIGV